MLTSMDRLSACVLSVLLLLTRSSLAQDPAPVPPPKDPVAFDEAVREGEFAGFVAIGDRERKAGRFGEAAKAYAAALKIKRDPLVAGRLGVILVELDQPTKAADLLLDALERAMNTTPGEREAFRKAYDLARAQVCRVEVQVTEAHAKIYLDGRIKQMPDLTGFTLYLAPGKHELRATLKGFDDAIVAFEAPKGGDIEVTLTLEQVSPLLESADKLLRKGPRHPVVTNAEDPPEDEAKREPVQGGIVGDQKSTGMRKTISAGPVVVFGVASWSPAVGAVLAGSLRPNEYVSLGLEGRAAWLTTGVGGAAINAMTAGGLVSACGHWRVFFGCGLGHLGLVHGTTSTDSFKPGSFTYFKPGGGGRVGLSVAPTHRFVLRGSVDVIGLSSGIRVVVRQTVIADQPPILVGAQIMGGWEF